MSTIRFLLHVKSKLQVKKEGEEKNERSARDKMVLLQKVRKGGRKERRRATKTKKNRLLITVTVIGSAGPIRLIVNEDDHVSLVIDYALKAYSWERRLPVLGSDAAHFFLYCSTDCEAMSPTEAVGSRGGRSFMQRKREINPQLVEERSEKAANKAIRRGGRWKAWLKNSFTFKLLSR